MISTIYNQTEKKSNKDPKRNQFLKLHVRILIICVKYIITYNVFNFLPVYICTLEETFEEDWKGIIRIRKSKDTEYNDRKKKAQRYND